MTQQIINNVIQLSLKERLYKLFHITNFKVVDEEFFKQFLDEQKRLRNVEYYQIAGWLWIQFAFKNELGHFAEYQVISLGKESKYSINVKYLRNKP